MGGRARGEAIDISSSVYSETTDVCQIQALSRTFRIPIHVIQRGPPTIVSHGGANDTAGGSLTPQQSVAEGERVVRISYHRRMYGLGEVSGTQQYDR
jgi:hypothetical protein